MANAPSHKLATAPASGLFLRRVREDVLHLSQQALAQRLGVRYQTIYRWETGETPVGHRKWLALIGLCALDGVDYEPIVDFVRSQALHTFGSEGVGARSHSYFSCAWRGTQVSSL